MIRISYDFVHCINYTNPDRNEDQRWMAVWYPPFHKRSLPTLFSLS